MLDGPIYNEIRKIDRMPVLANPTPGSLADLIKNSGEVPYTNFLFFKTTSTSYTQALSLQGKGKSLILCAIRGNAWIAIKITIDGSTVIQYDNYFLGGNITRTLNLGTYCFNNSIKVETLTSNSSYPAQLYISYYKQ